MQRRLFILLFPVMFLPAVGVMLLDWQRGREHLEVLEGPGLTRSNEASLDLARLVLEEEKARAEGWALRLATEPGLEPPPDVRAFLLEVADDGSWPGAPEEAADLLEATGPEILTEARRVGLPGSSSLLAAAPTDDTDASWVLVVQPLDPELDRLLADITAGGAGIRQLGLIYRKLLQSNLLLTLFGLTIFLLLLSLFVSNLLARSVARPLRELADGTRRVAEGDLEHRIATRAPAELGELVTAFNGMTADLEAGRQELRRAERVAAWQGVARRLAHEIKNPLTPINLAMHRISGKSRDETVQSCVRTVLEESANLGRLAEEFSMYAKLPTPEPSNLDGEGLCELIADVAEFYLARTRVTYEWEGWPAEFRLSVDTGQLRQVLSNLIKNGNEAMEGEGVLRFRLEAVPNPGLPIKTQHTGPWVRLSVLDTGPGLPDDPELLFEPYRTSKATGTGLGLAVSRRIVEDNGGCLWAEGGEQGAVFHIDLPDQRGE